MPALLVIGAVLLWWFQIWPFSPGYKYAPEVGYYTGAERVWYVGPEMETQDACAADAQAYYRRMNAQSPGRAFSWACRKMQGDRFLDRVR